MRWTESISEALDYMEAHISEELTIENIAKAACMSPFYFQKGFAMLCGFTVAEYLRCRRLALAGSELMATDDKIIDIALKYGYDSPDSFTKSFTRFHGATPTAVRKNGAGIKSFAPLKINFTLEGGYSMDYKIVEKGTFTVIGKAQTFRYDEAATQVPKIWQEMAAAEASHGICTTYGINYDVNMSGNEFEYLIGDNYNPIADIPDGFTTKVIPAYTWAVFACKGPMPQAMQEINKQIFQQWLPACKDYEIAAGYCIEVYTDPADYTGGTASADYASEMWIPLKRKTA